MPRIQKRRRKTNISVIVIMNQFTLMMKLVGIWSQVRRKMTLTMTLFKIILSFRPIRSISIVGRVHNSQGIN